MWWIVALLRIHPTHFLRSKNNPTCGFIVAQKPTPTGAQMSTALSVLKMNVWLKIDRPVDAEADIPMKDEASEKVKNLYRQNHKDDFIFWIDEEDDSMGCIKNNRSISFSCASTVLLELQQMKPAKGRGYVALAFISKAGNELGSIFANQCSKQALEWLSAIQPIIAKVAGLENRYSDHGFDT